MLYRQSRVLRFAAVFAIAAAASGFTPTRSSAPIPGMTFNLKVVLKQTPTSGHAPRAVTLMGHGEFAGGMGRVSIDTVDAPSAIRKGDFFIIRDSLNTFWARPSDMRVRRMNAPLVNPLEGISERLTSGMGSPRSLRVVFDTVSLDEMVNGFPTRHFRITADVVYPVGTRHVTQKVVIEQWLAKLPVRIMNPFGSRVRGLPEVPMANSMYREFIRTLAAANRVYGDAVTVRTATTTSYVYGPGLGEDFYQTVDLTDLQPADVDEGTFQLSAEYKLQQPERDPTRNPVAAPPRKPPAPGVTYRMRLVLIPPDIPGMPPQPQTVIVGRGATIGSQSRLDIDSVSGGLVPLTIGDYMLMLDSGRTVTVSPATKSYAEGTSALGAMPADVLAAAQFTNVSVTTEKLGAGETVQGFPTEKYRITTTYMLTLQGMGMNTMATADIWAAQLPGVVTTPFDGSVPKELAAGPMKELAEKMSVARKALGTLTPLKTVTTSSISGPMSFTTVNTVELLDVKTGEVDPALLKVPEGFAKKP